MQSLKRQNLSAIDSSTTLTKTERPKEFVRAPKMDIECGQQMPYDFLFHVVRCIRLLCEAFNASIRFGINFGAVFNEL